MDLINELRVRRALMSESNLTNSKGVQSLTDLRIPVTQDLVRTKAVSMSHH